MLYWIKRLEEERRIPVLPVFVDSPMAIDALARYTERLRELDADLQPETHDDKAPHGPADRAGKRPIGGASTRAANGASVRSAPSASGPSALPPSRRS